MSSTYRIFVNGSRVSTAVALSDGGVLQTYPGRDFCPSKDLWTFASFAEHCRGAKSFGVSLPDGSVVTYAPEKYTLFQGGRCVSAGLRFGSLFYQRFPFVDAFQSRDALIHERAPLFGVATSFRVKAKDSVVTPAPAPKERVSRWAKMSDGEREEWKERMRMSRTAAKELRKEFLAERASAAVLTPRVPSAPPVEFISVGELLGAREAYWDPNDASVSPTLRLLLGAYAKQGIRVRRSGEGCDSSI